MQLISKFNKEIRFLLCVIDIFSKYVCVIPLKDIQGNTIRNLRNLIQILDASKRKPNKIQVDKSSEFHNRSMKSWLKDNGIKMYSRNNEGKSVVDERFIRSLKTKIMTSTSKNVYIDKLDNIVNKYNNTYHSTIKMKPTSIKHNVCIELQKKKY